MKRLFFTFLGLICSIMTIAQTTFHISVLDTAYLPVGENPLQFRQESLNTLSANYHITAFRKAFPEARMLALRQVYEIRADSGLATLKIN